MAGGGRDEERRSKENAGAMIRETNAETLPRTAPETKKGEDQHEMGRWHYPQSREGGKVPS